MTSYYSADARERMRAEKCFCCWSRGCCSCVFAFLTLVIFVTGAALAASGLGVAGVEGYCYASGGGYVISETDFAGVTKYPYSYSSSSGPTTQQPENLVLTAKGLPAVDPHSYGANVDFLARGLGDAAPASIGALLLLGCCGAVVLALMPVALCCDLRDEGRETSRQLVRCVFPATAVAAIFLVTAASVYMDSVITPVVNSSIYRALASACRARSGCPSGVCCSCYFTAPGPSLQLSGALAVLLCGLPMLALVAHCGRGWMFEPRAGPTLFEAYNAQQAAESGRREQRVHRVRESMSSSPAAAPALLPLPRPPLLPTSPLPRPPPPTSPPPGVARRPDAFISPLVLQRAAARGLCVVCLDAPATHLCVPCGHLCGCSGCLGLLSRSSGACPMCRAHFTSFVHVFVAGAAESPDIFVAGAAAESLDDDYIV